MHRRGVPLVVASAAAGLLLWGAAAPAAATPPEGEVERTDLAEGTATTPIHIVTDGAPTTLTVQSLALRPGGGSGWHSHPGPEYSAITAGTVAVQTAGGCAGTEHGQGAAVFIPAGVVHRVTNAGPDTATVVVTYTLPAGAPARIDAPDVCA